MTNKNVDYSIFFVRVIFWIKLFFKSNKPYIHNGVMWYNTRGYLDF